MKMFYKRFERIYNTHCAQIITILMESGRYFSILCNMKKVSFNPLLPDDIMDKFDDFGLFVLAGLSFESLLIDGNHIVFEAGFGNKDEASLVNISLDGIYQIVAKDISDNTDLILFSRVDAGLIYNDEELLISKKEKMLDEGERFSMEAIFSNEENENVIKKIKSKNINR